MKGQLITRVHKAFATCHLIVFIRHLYSAAGLPSFTTAGKLSIVPLDVFLLNTIKDYITIIHLLQKWGANMRVSCNLPLVTAMKQG